MMRNNTITVIGKILLMLAPLLAFNISFAGWELLQNSPTTNDLHSVFFLDDNTGWIAGDNSTIFKTTNSGVSWIQQTSPEPSNFQCITFVNADTGWACGTGGTVIKTTNGGANWFSQTFTGSKFNSMDFWNSTWGFIAGDFGNIRKTTDGGSTWTTQVSGVNQNLHQIKFDGVDPSRAFAVGDNAIILKTTNGGSDWDTVSGPGIANQIFYSVANTRSHDYIKLTVGTLAKYSMNYGSIW